jgi:hypothetical protein
MATTEDIRSWMKDFPEIYNGIVEITKDAIAFQCHPDKFNLAVNHSVTYPFFGFLQACSRAFQAMCVSSSSTLDHKGCETD